MANTLKFGNGEWAIKEGSALAYNDENGNFKPLPFDFSRSTSATRVNKQGLIELVSNNEPRIDFLNDSEGSLKLEPQRTNLITYSSDFSNAAWSKTGVTVTANSTTSPSGDINADTLAFGAIGSEIVQSVSGLTAGQDYTLSIYLKVASGTTTMSFGNISYETTSITVTSEWQRFTITQSAVSATRFPKLVCTESVNVYAYGAQVEQGSYPTSYIPTAGSIGTRVSESCEQTPPSGIINSTEGVLYVEMNAFDNISRISLSDGSSSNRVSFRIDANSIDFQYRIGGSYSYRVDVDIDTSNTNKIAMSFNNGVFVGYLNGVAIGSPISGPSLSQGVLDRLNFNDGDSSDSFEGNIKDVRVYNTALTDQELQTLTTI